MVGNSLSRHFALSFRFTPHPKQHMLLTAGKEAAAAATAAQDTRAPKENFRKNSKKESSNIKQDVMK